MKLLHCTYCGDIVAVLRHARTCECGDSEARYVDDKIVYFSGPARILAMPNEDLAESRPGPPKKGKAGFGPEYRWWVIGEHFDKAIKRVDDVNQEPAPKTPRKRPSPGPIGGGGDPFELRGEMAQLHAEQALHADMEAGRSLCLEGDLEREAEMFREVGDVPDNDPWLGFPPTDM